MEEGYFAFQSLAILALHGRTDLVGDEIRLRDACPKDRQEHSSLERLVTVVEDTYHVIGLKSQTIAMTRYPQLYTKGTSRDYLGTAVTLALDGNGVTYIWVKSIQNNNYIVYWLAKNFHAKESGVSNYQLLS